MDILKENTPIIMDYKKVYDLFLGETNHDAVITRRSPDIENEERVMQEDFLNDAWYTVPYTLTAAGHYEVGERHSTSRSNGDFYELISTVSGHGIVTVGNQTFDCVANTVLLINCEEPHFFRVKRGDTWEYKHIHFIPNGVAKNVADRAMLSIVNDSGSIDSRFANILSELHHINADTHFLISHGISAILTEMIRYQFKNSFTDPQEDLVRRVVDYIHKHYMEKINIKQLAEDEFISPYHFIRLFKKYHGVPPYNYLMDYRLKRAQYLFMQQKSVKEVAQECGFSSTNSFSRAFQKRFGIVPSQYRDGIAAQKIDPSVDFFQNNREMEEQ